jgi:hypothetical protein
VVVIRKPEPAMPSAYRVGGILHSGASPVNYFLEVNFGKPENPCWPVSIDFTASSFCTHCPIELIDTTRQAVKRHLRVSDALSLRIIRSRVRRVSFVLEKSDEKNTRGIWSHHLVSMRQCKWMHAALA